MSVVCSYYKMASSTLRNRNQQMFLFAYLPIKSTKEAIKIHKTAVSKTLTIRPQRAVVSEKHEIKKMKSVATPTILREIPGHGPERGNWSRSQQIPEVKEPDPDSEDSHVREQKTEGFPTQRAGQMSWCRQGEHWLFGKTRLRKLKELLSDIFTGLDTGLGATRQTVEAKTSWRIRCSTPEGLSWVIGNYSPETRHCPQQITEAGLNEIKLLPNNLTSFQSRINRNTDISNSNKMCPICYPTKDYQEIQRVRINHRV